MTTLSYYLVANCRISNIFDSDEGYTGNETFEITDLFETKKLFDSICEKYFV